MAALPYPTIMDSGLWQRIIATLVSILTAQERVTVMVDHGHSRILIARVC